MVTLVNLDTSVSETGRRGVRCSLSAEVVVRSERDLTFVLREMRKSIERCADLFEGEVIRADLDLRPPLTVPDPLSILVHVEQSSENLVNTMLENTCGNCAHFGGCSESAGCNFSCGRFEP